MLRVGKVVRARHSIIARRTRLCIHCRNDDFRLEFVCIAQSKIASFGLLRRYQSRRAPARGGRGIPPFAREVPGIPQYECMTFVQTVLKSDDSIFLP